MYIAPNSKVRLIKNCPLDNGYEHTLFFHSPGGQEYYFQTTLTGYLFENMSYVRVNKGVIRVQMNAEYLYNCNYMCFQNTSFGNKWFYAFVTKVEYINNVTTEINFELDILQTWHFNYRIPACFVERTHASTDVAGDNLVPEGVETGDYVAQTSGRDLELEALSLVIATTFKPGPDGFVNVEGGTYSELFTGLHYLVYPMGYYPLDPLDPYYDPDHAGEYGPDLAAEFLLNATELGKSSGIVSVFLMPRCFVTDEGPAQFVKRHIYTTAKVTSGTIDGYTPKNNKLFTYPYNFLYVANQQGNSGVYPYEFFSGASCQFDVAGDMSPNPSVVLQPMNFKGILVNADEKMVLSGYPQLPYNIDAFKAWLAMNAANIAVDALSNGLTAVTGIATGNFGGAVQGLMGFMRMGAERYQHEIMPPQSKGGGGAITACALRIQNFLFIRKTIRAEFARIIDDFFTVFGYAQHKIMQPSRKVRTEWTYLKTVNCKIEPGYPDDCVAQQTPPEAGLPADDARRIEQIYNTGITFWMNGAHMGDYTLNNAIVSVSNGNSNQSEGGGAGGQTAEP